MEEMEQQEPKMASVFGLDKSCQTLFQQIVQQVMASFDLPAHPKGIAPWYEINGDGKKCMVIVHLRPALGDLSITFGVGEKDKWWDVVTITEQRAYPAKRMGKIDAGQNMSPEEIQEFLDRWTDTAVEIALKRLQRLTVVSEHFLKKSATFKALRAAIED